MLSGHSESSFWKAVEQVCDDIQVSQTNSVETSWVHLDAENIFEYPVNCRQEAYSQSLAQVLQSVAPAFENNAEVHDCAQALADADSILAQVEKSLMSIIGSLEAPVQSVNECSENLDSLLQQLESTNIINNDIDVFSQEINITTSLKTDIEQADTHSKEFLEALTTLSRKLAFFDLRRSRKAESCMETVQSLQGIQKYAVQRVEERLMLTMKLLEAPGTNFEIIRDSLLCSKKYLIEFALDHDHGVVVRVSQRYSQIASAFLLREVTAYCKVMIGNHEKHSRGSDIFDLSSLVSGPSNIWSTIVSDTLGVPAKETVQALDNGSATAKDSQHAVESIASAERDEIIRSLDRCQSALHRVESVSLSLTELSMEMDCQKFEIEEIVGNCTKFVLHLIEKEEDFLTNTFGEDSRSLLISICTGKMDPILQLILMKLDGMSRENCSDMVGVLTALLIGRKYRSHISKWDVIDPRMKYLVEAEKALQMWLLNNLDTRREDVRNRSELGRECDMRVLEEVEFVRNLLAVVVGCGEEVDGADICEAVSRRLQCLVKEIVDCISKYSEQIGNVRRCRKKQLCDLSMILGGIEVPKRLAHKDELYNAVRRPVLTLFDKLAEEFGKVVVRQHAGELFEIEKSIDEEERTIRCLEEFGGSWKDRLISIREAYEFLNRENGKWYWSRARKSAFKLMCRQLDRVSIAVEEKYRSECHLVVSKTAVLHTLREMNGGESGE